MGLLSYTNLRGYLIILSVKKKTKKNHFCLVSSVLQHQTERKHLSLKLVAQKRYASVIQVTFSPLYSMRTEAGRDEEMYKGILEVCGRARDL